MICTDCKGKQKGWQGDPGYYVELCDKHGNMEQNYEDEFNYSQQILKDTHLYRQQAHDLQQEVYRLNRKLKEIER